MSGFDGLTGDEGYTVGLAQRSFTHMTALFTREANGISYPLLLFPMVRIDTSLFVLRLPALIAGIAAVPAVYWAGTRLTSRSAGLVAAGLLAVNPAAIAYSQLARPRVFALLFGILAFGFLASAVEKGRRRDWIGYVATMAVAAYSQSLVLPLLLVPQAVLVVVRRRENVAREWLMSVALIGVLVIPLVVLLAIARTKRNALYWLDPPSLASIKTTFIILVSGRVAAAIIICTVALSLAMVVRASKKQIRPFLVPLGWAVIPLLVLYTISQITPVFALLYALPALPGILILMAVAAIRLPLVLAAVAIASVTALSVRATVVGDYHEPGWQSAAHALTRERAADDAVIFDIPDGLVAAGYYDRQFAAADGTLIVPEWRDRPIPAGVLVLDDPGGYSRTETGPPSMALIAKLTQRHRRVFVMLYETARQGYVPSTAGLAWAARNCTVQTDTHGWVMMLTISRCAA